MEVPAFFRPPDLDTKGYKKRKKREAEEKPANKSKKDMSDKTKRQSKPTRQEEVKSK